MTKVVSLDDEVEDTPESESTIEACPVVISEKKRHFLQKPSYHFLPVTLTFDFSQIIQDFKSK